MTMKSTRQIAIVGAGPVGLSLALGLARRGVDVLVLEKNAETAEFSRAPAIWPRTQEVLAGLGVMDDFLKEGIIHPRLEIQDVDRDSLLVSFPLEDLAGRTDYPHLLILPQSRTEKLLLEAVRREETAEVRFSCDVTELIQHDERVEVRFSESGSDTARDARFVAGCDGAHSMARHAVGAELEGITYDLRAALADVRLENSSGLHSPRLTTRPRLAIGIRIAENLWRLILPFRENDSIPLEQRVEDAAGRLFRGSNWQPLWQSEFRLHNRVATTFSKDRIVLAGDAAHLNSPVGGQGMNAGIQDAGLLIPALIEALGQGDDQPLAEYGHRRRTEIERGVNRFTGIMTRMLMIRRGRMIRPILGLVNRAMQIGPIRRRIIGNLGMLD